MRGRKQPRRVYAHCARIVPKTLPREGMETLKELSFACQVSRVLKPLPREGMETFPRVLWAPTILRVSKTLPREGTETVVPKRFAITSRCFITHSPQGDEYPSTPTPRLARSGGFMKNYAAKLRGRVRILRPFPNLFRGRRY